MLIRQRILTNEERWKFASRELETVLPYRSTWKRNKKNFCIPAGCIVQFVYHAFRVEADGKTIPRDSVPLRIEYTKRCKRRKNNIREIGNITVSYRELLLLLCLPCLSVYEVVVGSPHYIISVERYLTYIRILISRPITEMGRLNQTLCMNLIYTETFDVIKSRGSIIANCCLGTGRWLFWIDSKIYFELFPPCDF